MKKDAFSLHGMAEMILVPLHFFKCFANSFHMEVHLGSLCCLHCAVEETEYERFRDSSLN